MSTDTRIAYGARCTWWDSIDKIGKTDGPISLPCCPHCGNVLFEVPHIDDWMGPVEHRDASIEPGYRKMVEWARGKCFPNYPTLRVAYNTEMARAH